VLRAGRNRAHARLEYDWHLRRATELFSTNARAPVRSLSPILTVTAPLELFIGGRVMPGRWPQPASSRVYKTRRHMGVGCREHSCGDGAGLVCGAVFSI